MGKGRAEGQSGQRTDMRGRNAPTQNVSSALSALTRKAEREPEHRFQYECNWHRREGLAGSSCLSTRGDLLDRCVSQRVLEAVEPMQIEIALEAARQLAQRDEQLQRQWQLRLQRAEYEAQLAERNYRAVDATNRLLWGGVGRAPADPLAGWKPAPPFPLFQSVARGNSIPSHG